MNSNEVGKIYIPVALQHLTLKSQISSLVIVHLTKALKYCTTTKMVKDK